MRRVGILCTTALTGVAALSLLSGCRSGLAPQASDTSSAAVASSSAGASDASSGGGGATPAASSSAASFCTQAQKLATRPGGNTSDPAAAAEFFQQGADAFRSMQPPPEISSDWSAIANGLDQLSAAYRSTDVNDSSQEAALERTVTQVENQIGPAQNAVAAYLQKNCGITLGTGMQAAPSS